MIFFWLGRSIFDLNFWNTTSEFEGFNIWHEMTNMIFLAISKHPTFGSVAVGFEAGLSLPETEVTLCSMKYAEMFSVPCGVTSSFP